METLHKKIKFSIKDFFSKCDQIRKKLQIWLHLLKKSLMENFIFYAVSKIKNVKKLNVWGHWNITLFISNLYRLCYGWNFVCKTYDLIQDGYFRGCSRMGVAKRSPLPKICDKYPTTMKLATVIPYLGKIQKKYQSRDTPSGSCWHQHFFTGNQQSFLYQEIQK